MLTRSIFRLHQLSKIGNFKFCVQHSELDNFETVKPHYRSRFNKAAIILSGCGVYDGSEVTEVVSLMIQLNKMNVEFQCFAPNQNQMHVINHINGETSTETRNVLVESARLARGEVKDIAELNCNDFQAVLLPGGFGAAKNLSDYAVKGASFDVHEQVKRVITEFHALKKPIGAMCISPLLIAKVLEGKSPKITMGKVDRLEAPKKLWPHGDAIAVAEELGADHTMRNSDKFQIDFENKLVTIPAMMFNGFSKFSSTFDGVVNLCKITEQIVLGLPVKIENFLPKRVDDSFKETSEGTAHHPTRERRPYNNTDDTFDGVNHKPYRETKSYHSEGTEPKPYRERKPYNSNYKGSSENSEGTEPKPYRERKPYNSNYKSFNENSDGSEPKPYRERKPYHSEEGYNKRQGSKFSLDEDQQ